jgi:cytochrome c oxidase subunit IV
MGALFIIDSAAWQGLALIETAREMMLVLAGQAVAVFMSMANEPKSHDPRMSS